MVLCWRLAPAEPEQSELILESSRLGNFALTRFLLTLILAGCLTSLLLEAGARPPPIDDCTAGQCRVGFIEKIVKSACKPGEPTAVVEEIIARALGDGNEAWVLVLMSVLEITDRQRRGSGSRCFQQVSQFRNRSILSVI